MKRIINIILFTMLAYLTVMFVKIFLLPHAWGIKQRMVFFLFSPSVAAAAIVALIMGVIKNRRNWVLWTLLALMVLFWVRGAIFMSQMP